MKHEYKRIIKELDKTSRGVIDKYNYLEGFSFGSADTNDEGGSQREKTFTSQINVEAIQLKEDLQRIIKDLDKLIR